jgi:hypothetical protein
VSSTRPDDPRGTAPRPGASDDGHTSGGGSLGHDQPGKVQGDAPTRNAPPRENTPPGTGGRNATGSESDPVMPRDDAALKTKI